MSSRKFPRPAFMPAFTHTPRGVGPSKSTTYGCTPPRSQLLVAVYTHVARSPRKLPGRKKSERNHRGLLGELNESVGVRRAARWLLATARYDYSVWCATQKSWWACLLELNTDPATKDSQPYQCITQVLSDMSVQRSSSSSGRSFCMSTGIGS